MATKAAHKRLTKEAQMMAKDPPPLCFARPKEDNILEWHFILRGAPDTPYEGGEYWGQLIFPGDYPFKPPGIKVSTPSGRFATDTKICTSMSDFHPGTWNPAWSVSNILIGLLSFMSADEMTTGSVKATESDRKIFSQRSHEWNIKQKKFQTLFPEYSSSACRDLPNMGKPGQPGGGDLKGSKALNAETSTNTGAGTSSTTNQKVRANPAPPQNQTSNLYQSSSSTTSTNRTDSTNLLDSNPTGGVGTSLKGVGRGETKVKVQKETGLVYKSMIAVVGAGMAWLFARGAGWV